MVKAHGFLRCDILSLHNVTKCLELRTLGSPAEEDGQRPERAGFQLLLVLLRHARVAVGEDDGFVEAVGEDECLS